MSLASVVLEIADVMERDVAGFADGLDKTTYNLISIMICGHARTLRMAVKAADNATTRKLPTDAEIAARQAAALERKQADALMLKQGGGYNTAELVGSGLDGDMVEIDPKMPIGAKMLIADKVWQLRDDRKLHHVEG